LSAGEGEKEVCKLGSISSVCKFTPKRVNVFTPLSKIFQEALSQSFARLEMKEIKFSFVLAKNAKMSKHRPAP
jgi:hypothetical protein